MFALPDGYEVLLGNGGTTAFWDAASFGAHRRTAATTWCSASSRPSSPRSPARAPHLGEPSTAKADPGTAPALAAVERASTPTA